jgi:hypothetical protein
MKKIGLILFVSLFLLLFTNTGLVRAGIEPATPSATPTATLNYATPLVLPGSPFYFFKRMWENVQLLMANNPSDKVKLLTSVSKERLVEANALIEGGRSSEVQAVLFDYSNNKKDQVKIINTQGAKIDSLVTNTALANNLEELSALNVLKQNSPLKIDQSVINKIQDIVEVSTEGAVNQVDHPVNGGPLSPGAMPGMPNVPSNANPIMTPAVSSDNHIPAQIDSVPLISSDSLNQSSLTSTSTIPLTTSDNTATPSADQNASASAFPADQTPAAPDQTQATPDQNTAPPASGDNLYSATDSAQPAALGASTSQDVNLWEHLFNFFSNLFR